MRSALPLSRFIALARHVAVQSEKPQITRLEHQADRSELIHSKGMLNLRPRPPISFIATSRSFPGDRFSSGLVPFGKILKSIEPCQGAPRTTVIAVLGVGEILFGWEPDGRSTTKMSLNVIRSSELLANTASDSLHSQYGLPPEIHITLVKGRSTDIGSFPVVLSEDSKTSNAILEPPSGRGMRQGFPMM